MGNAMSDFPPNPSAIEQLGKLARELATAPIPTETHQAGRQRLMAKVRSEYRPNGGWVLRGTWFKPVLAAAMCALALAALWLLRPRPLTYAMQGGSRFASGSLSVANDEPAALRFSDGTVIDASPGTRIRVDNLEADGARVVLESGNARAEVHHGKSSSWLFVAGPFEVRVLGTAFDLAWDPAKAEVDLVLHRGQTEVRSPLGQGPITVAAGQHLHASLRARSVHLDEIAPEPAPAESSTGAGATPFEPPEPQVPAESNTAGGSVTTEKSLSGPSAPPLPTSQLANKRESARGSWSDLAREGQFKTVVDEALQGNIDRCLSTCPIADLHALADSARYVGNPQVAEQSLRAMRQRLAGGEQRAWAAFMLGRIAETRGQASRANTWYDTYLNEAPQGQYAADALAGKMQTTLLLHGTAAAKPLAVQYLQRYPHGVHSAMARKIDGTTP
jgi:ferric-dicitrate binding protein FerR (iron transport regulator)